MGDLLWINVTDDTDVTQNGFLGLRAFKDVYNLQNSGKKSLFIKSMMQENEQCN